MYQHSRDFTPENFPGQDFHLVKLNQNVTVNISNCDEGELAELDNILLAQILIIENQLADYKDREEKGGEKNHKWVASCKAAMKIKRVQRQLIQTRRGNLRDEIKKKNIYWAERERLIIEVVKQYLTPAQMLEFYATKHELLGEAKF